MSESLEKVIAAALDEWGIEVGHIAAAVREWLLGDPQIERIHRAMYESDGPDDARAALSAILESPNREEGE